MVWSGVFGGGKTAYRDSLEWGVRWWEDRLPRQFGVERSVVGNEPRNVVRPHPAKEILEVNSFEPSIQFPIKTIHPFNLSSQGLSIYFEIGKPIILCFLMRSILLTLLAFLLPFSAMAQSLNWADGLTGTGSAMGTLAEVLPNGDMIAAGIWGGTVDIDPGPQTNMFTSAGYMDAYFMKLDANGNQLWVKRFGMAGSEWLSDILVDGAGNIYLSGYLKNTIDFDPGPGTFLINPSGTVEAFLAKYDQNGNFIWAIATENLNTLQVWSYGDAIEFDPQGNILFSGLFTGTVDFDPGTGNTSLTSIPSNSRNGFLATYSPAGGLISVVNTVSGAPAWSQHLTLDGAGNQYLAGTFTGTVDLDPGTGVQSATNPNFDDIFIQKLDGSGNLVWARTFGGTGTEKVTDLRVDNNGNVFVVGSFEGQVDMNPGPGTDLHISNGFEDFYLTKLNGNGIFQWSRTLGGTNFDSGDHIEIDPDGKLIVSGYFKDSVDLDPGPGVLQEYSDENAMFLNIFDQSGNLTGLKVLNPSGANNAVRPYGLNLNANGTLAVLGTFYGTVDMDPGPGTATLTAGSNIFQGFISSWSIDSCLGTTLWLDSLTTPTCSAPGYLGFQGLGGIPPYSYSWSNYPAVTGPSHQVTIGGIETVVMTDAQGCMDSVAILVPGPTYNAIDLRAHLTNSPFQSGFSGTVNIDAFNAGCIPTGGDLILILDPNLTYTNAIPAPTTINGDTLIWSFPPMTYDSAHLTPIVHFTTDTSVTVGDSVCLNLSVTYWNGDINANNNIFNDCFPVVAAYDPNDKQVYPGGICTPHYVSPGEPLIYTVRFQNTGNANAVNVSVIDSLSPALDINSAVVIGQSHPGLITEVLSENTLRFNFEDINLPDSTSDFQGSMGYVMFEIYPENNILDGTRIENFVDIYFDFNPAVRTNTVFNTVESNIPVLDLNVTFANAELTVGSSGAVYQWIDCNTGVAIPGATSQSYSPLVSGSYAVSVDLAGCAGTSDCLPVTVVGLDADRLDRAVLYPNPNSGQFTFDPGSLSEYSFSVSDMTGRQLVRREVRNGGEVELEFDFPEGMYLMQVWVDGNSKGILFRVVR